MYLFYDKDIKKSKEEKPNEEKYEPHQTFWLPRKTWLTKNLLVLNFDILYTNSIMH